MVYPSRHPHSNPKKPARQKFDAAVKRGVPAADIFRGAFNYAKYVEQEKKDPEHVAQAITFLSQERWAEYQEPPKPANRSSNPQPDELDYDTPSTTPRRGRRNAPWL